MTAHKDMENYKLIDRKQASEMVTYSVSQLIRLEQSGRFPKSIRIGQNRVAYRLAEILEWIDEQPLSHSNGPAGEPWDQ